MNSLSHTARLFVLLVMAASVSACNNDDPSHNEEMTAASVLRNNLMAVRANSLDRAIKNTDKIIQINEAGYSLIARYRATSDGFMRIDIFDGGNRVYSEGKDEKGVWEWSGEQDGPEGVSHEGAAAIEHGIEFNLYPLAELSNRGHNIELVGTESVRDRQYIVLKVVLSDGFETYRYVNPESWLVDVSRDFRAFHPGIDSTKKNIETRYDQWIQSDGIVFASRSQNIDLASGEVIATTIVLESAYNRPHETLNLARHYVPTDGPILSNQVMKNN